MVHRRFSVFIIVTLLVACASAPAFGGMDAETEQLARWQLNNADLLVDEGKYMEAVEYIDSAYEMNQFHKTRSDALLAKAMVMATFLDAPNEATATYQKLAIEFPAYGEIADYQSAFLLLQTDKTEEAKTAFQNYLKKYPNGRFRFQSEAMLESMGVPGAKPDKPIVVEGRPVMRVLLDRKSVVEGKSVFACVEHGGLRIIKKKK